MKRRKTPVSPLGRDYLKQPNAYVRRGELGAVVANLVRQQRRDLDSRTLVGLVAAALAYVDVHVVAPITARFRRVSR